MNNKAIIQKSTELFLQNGYKTVTMDDIAMELAISKKTLYEEFGKKENLIEAALHNQFQQIAEMIELVMSRDLNAVQELIEIKQSVTDRFNSPHQKNAVYQLQKYYLKLHQKVYLNKFSMVQKVLTRNIIKGQEQGLYRPEVNSENTAEVLMMAQSAMKTNKKLLTSPEAMESLKDLLSDIIFRGILTQKGLEIYIKAKNLNQ